MYNVAYQCGTAKQYVLRNRKRIGKPFRDCLKQFVLQLTVLTLLLKDNSTGDVCANVGCREALGQARRIQPSEAFQQKRLYRLIPYQQNSPYDICTYEVSPHTHNILPTQVSINTRGRVCHVKWAVPQIIIRHNVNLQSFTLHAHQDQTCDRRPQGQVESRI